MGSLEGKTALITGAARGIGRAFAERYVQEGARVAICDIDIEQAKKTAAKIGEKAIAIPLDVGRQESIDAAVSQVIRHFGHIDILVNNAGIGYLAPIRNVSRECFDRTFAVNVAGTFFMIQAVARHMIARGKGGKIINVASQADRRDEALCVVYCASEAAVISLTHSAALRLIKYGINVNAISPGVLDTEFRDRSDAMFAEIENRSLGEKKRLGAEAVKFGRMGKLGDLTGMAVILATHGAEYIVGQTYNVDGGNWLS